MLVYFVSGASSADRLGLMRRIGCTLANSIDESVWPGDGIGRRLDLCFDCKVHLVLRKTFSSTSELKQISFGDVPNRIDIHLLRTSSDAAEVLEGGDRGFAIPTNLSSLDMYVSPWNCFSCFTRSHGLPHVLEQSTQWVSLMMSASGSCIGSFVWSRMCLYICSNLPKFFLQDTARHAYCVEIGGARASSSRCKIATWCLRSSIVADIEETRSLSSLSSLVQCFDDPERRRLSLLSGGCGPEQH